ncbi:MAG: TldD/PmbA family protein [candidate division WOR-3 bacterium]|nr:MAG: TldD/PmbA family protein [candidate division WOR-3 bacterium]
MDQGLVTLIREILVAAEEKIPYAVATFFSNRGLDIVLDKKDERLSSAPSNMGFVLSIFNGVYFEEFATDIVEKDHLSKFCRTALQTVEVKDIKHVLMPPTIGKKSFKTVEKIDPDSIPLHEKIDIFRERRQQILSGKNVVNCVINYSEESSTKVFISPKGVINEEIRRIAHYLMVYVSNGKALKYDYFSTGGTGGFELTELPEGTIDEIIGSANRLLTSEHIEPGFYDVVGTPEIAGLIAHEAFGHGVETDMYLQNRARSRDYLGKDIASPSVNIIDDPSLPGGYGSYYIDDEGNTAQPTYIIKDGKFIQGLTHKYASAVLDLPPTANGRRESFSRKIYTRMSNTFFKSGSVTPNDIIASVDNGIYLIKGLSGMEDPKGWGIQVLVLYGREIKNGRITDRLFSPLGITGYVPDLLKSVSLVGNDFKIDVGTCGKGHKEYVPVSSGGPHIRTRVRLG